MRIEKDFFDYHPLHDAEFISFTLQQNDKGEITIALRVIPYQEEWDPVLFNEASGVEVLFFDCVTINFQSGHGMAQRDSVYHIQLEALQTADSITTQVHILMSSGNELHFTANYIELNIL